MLFPLKDGLGDHIYFCLPSLPEPHTASVSRTRRN